MNALNVTMLRSDTLLPPDFDDLSLTGDLRGEYGLRPRSEARVDARSALSRLLAMDEAGLGHAIRDVPHKHGEIAAQAVALCSSDAPGERAQAFRILELLVECGEQGATFNYAKELIRGVNVLRDVPRAEGLLQHLERQVDGNRKPALLGLVIANLGLVRSARGDMKAALENFARGARHSEEAAFAAGLAYDKQFTEYGVERDVQKAAAFYQSAATRKYAPAMTNLGLLIATCEWENHHARGWELLREAARLGDTVADETLEWLNGLDVNPDDPPDFYQPQMSRALKRRNCVAFFVGHDEVESDQQFELQLELNGLSAQRHEFMLECGSRVVMDLQPAGKSPIREGVARFYVDAQTHPIAFALFDLLSRGKYKTHSGLFRALDDDSSGNAECGRIVESMYPNEGMCSALDRIGAACNFYELHFRPSVNADTHRRVQLAKQFMDHLSSDFGVGLHLVAASDRQLVRQAIVGIGGSVVDNWRVAYGQPGVTRRLAAMNIAHRRLP